MKQINFIFCIHNHQPVGNFDSVLEKSFERSYAPFVDVLLKYPSIKVSLHISGNLLYWLADKKKDYIAKIKELVAKGQLELLSSGLYEPILAVLPEVDRIGQIVKFNSVIYELTGYKPKGIWLTERIYEPHLPKSLSKAGVDYIVVDDYHFIKTGLKEEDLFGYYITEDEGYIIKVFPGSEKLRYFVPFRDVNDTLEYFKSVAAAPNGNLAVFADDGEKFGSWPHTYEWVYGERWLEKFFSMLEANKNIVQTTTFSEYISTNKPLGRVYLPTASYMEMGEWTLPADAAVSYENILKSANQSGNSELKRFISGGIWRNYFAKYPESNNMHKKMLYVSEKIHKFYKDPVESQKNILNSHCEHSEAISPIDKTIADEIASAKKPPRNDNLEAVQSPYKEYVLQNTPPALMELYKGQCNDAYWHGIFGGLYLPHLRDAIYRHLISAEKLLESESGQKKPYLEIKRYDLNRDFRDELIVESDHYNMYMQPDYGGSIYEYDYKPASFNIMNSLTKRREGYHYKLLEAKKSTECGTGVKTIHEQTLTKETGLDKLLNFDQHNRVSLLDHFFDNISLEELKECKYDERGDFVGKEYDTEIVPHETQPKIILRRKSFVKQNGLKVNVELKKVITLNKGGSELAIDYYVKNLSKEELTAVFGVEFNITLLSPNDENRFFEVPGHVLNHSNLASEGELYDVKEIRMVDRYFSFDVCFSFPERCNFYRFPIETVSISEEGFERIFQASSLLFFKMLTLAENDEFFFPIRYEIKNKNP